MGGRGLGLGAVPSVDPVSSFLLTVGLLASVVGFLATGGFGFWSLAGLGLILGLGVEPVEEFDCSGGARLESPLATGGAELVVTASSALVGGLTGS